MLNQSIVSFYLLFTIFNLLSLMGGCQKGESAMRYAFNVLVAVAVILAATLVFSSDVVQAQPSTQVIFHLNPGQRVAVFGYGQCAIKPDTSCDGFDLVRGHMDDLRAGADGIITDELGYDFVKIYYMFTLEYHAGSMSYDRIYTGDPIIVASLKYGQIPTRVNIWPSLEEWNPRTNWPPNDDGRLSYVEGSIVVLMGSDARRVVSSIKPENRYIEDSWKAAVLQAAKQKWPDW